MQMKCDLNEWPLTSLSPSPTPINIRWIDGQTPDLGLSWRQLCASVFLGATSAFYCFFFLIFFYLFHFLLYTSSHLPQFSFALFYFKISIRNQIFTLLYDNFIVILQVFFLSSGFKETNMSCKLCKRETKIKYIVLVWEMLTWIWFTATW